jgi:hypothetical protein
MEDFQTRCLQRQTWVFEEWRDGKLLIWVGSKSVGHGLEAVPAIVLNLSRLESLGWAEVR